MNFIDLNKNDIMNNSVVKDDKYIYNIGEPIEVTCLKNEDSNNLMIKNLSSDILEDRLMIHYRPTNKIIFDKDFVDSYSDNDFSSYEVNENNHIITVGKPNKYKYNNGVLLFSGFLSANNLVEKDRFIYGNSRILDTIKKKVFILSIGVRGNMLYALYYITSYKGIAVSVKDSKTEGISVNTLKLCDCSNSNRFTVKDWFDNSKIVEL